MTLTRLAHTIVLAEGWWRILIAFLAGASTTLALPPTDIWLLPFITFPILVWLVDGAAGRRFGGVLATAAVGWWFGFGYFLAGLYWVGHAFLVDAKTFGWLLPFAVVALPAGMAVYTAFGLALARLIWTRGAARVLALAVSLTLAEWLRGHLFSGFPWNAYGYALISPIWLAQGAALVGIWGLTFLAVAVYASPAVLADERADTRRPWLAPALSAAAIAALALYGAVRLERTPTSYVEDVRLRIMQPNLQQDEKFNYAQKQQVMSRYLALSDRPSGPQSPGLRGVTLLIWPESAFPFFLTREPDALAQIAALLPSETVLITGAIRAPETAVNAPVTRAYNSIYVIDHHGSILSVYDKVHLVPFGEYLPLQGLLERLGLMQLTKVRGGFIPGEQRRSQPAPGAPNFLPLVCYEIIFPGNAVPRSERKGWLYRHVGRYFDWPSVTGSGERPGWLLNLTNDGWFGASAGPYQHFQQARIRAIEEGLPLVRAANSGISAVVDPLGRIVKSLPLGAEGVLDAPLPQPVAATLYARWGDALVGVVVAIAFLGVLVSRWRAPPA
ncbi:MAG: apolipoprotein N-acyltransferase [Hyphomicrobiales bacterium]|nr:apolipoprotein N-acyltransferase [Hyphomicrobiales bacterium]MBV8421978.1 apolipoprotein N-acyltransferase [Hyphomicrobiales bacterium]